MSLSDFQPVIGLEVHAQITTNAKLFSGAATAFGAEPNAHKLSVVEQLLSGRCCRNQSPEALGASDYSRCKAAALPSKVLWNGLSEYTLGLQLTSLNDKMER